MITLMETTRITKSRLELLRDDVLVIELNSIKDKAIDNAEAITNYGVPAERLTKFINSITQYTKALGARASGGSQKTGATKSLTTLFKEADSMLDSIDRLMENYRDTHKEFYDG